VPEVGQGHLAEIRIEVWFDNNAEIEEVKIIQDTSVIFPRLAISHEKSKCQESDLKAKCDTTIISPIFLEPLNHNVTAIKAIDFERRDQTTYLNDGFDISGNSLNPMQNKMIPSSVKDEGLIKVTQTKKYSPYWVSEDGRMFEKNNFDSFKQLDITFERFADTGTAYTRQHSGFGGIMTYEQNRALTVFNATTILSELPDSFSHDISIGERITEELKVKMTEQEKIAREFLEIKNVQARW
jgi:hypothetical protein